MPPGLRPHNQGVAKSLSWRFVGAVFNNLYHLEVEGQEKVPMSGPGIVAGNHLSALDIVLGAVSPRPLVFIGRGDLFAYPGLRLVLNDLGIIPVDRGNADVGAIKAALRVLQTGGAVGIFPEGTRSRSHTLASFKTGVAALAIRSRASVVPVGIAGTDSAWPVGSYPRFWQTIQIKFGDPIISSDFGEKTNKFAMMALAETLEEAVSQLIPAKYLQEEKV